MGLIKITTAGSFGTSERIFSAMKNGHVSAIAQAIEYLSGGMMHEANHKDHRCHTQNEFPEDGWDKRRSDA